MRARPKTQPEINKFRRETLIAATIKIVAKNGIENTTIAKICEAAGVSRGLAGHYFQDKEDLLCQAYQHLQDRHGERTAAAARAVKDDGAANRLKAIVDANFAPDPNIRDYRTAYLAFWTLSMTNTKIAKITSNAYRVFYASVEALLSRAAEEHKIKLDPHEASITLISLIDGFWLDISIGVPDVTPKVAVGSICAHLDRMLEADATQTSVKRSSRSSSTNAKGAAA